MTPRESQKHGESGPPNPPRPRPFREAIGVALQKHRLRRGLTQAQLAEFADLSLKYVGEIERGAANTTLDAIERLASAMDWNPLDALDGAREPLTEGVRQHLLTNITRSRERFADMEGWLRALDPARHPAARHLGVPVEPRKRTRSRARPSSPRSQTPK